MRLASGHNITGESNDFIDQELEQLFTNLQETDPNFFENTVVTIYSDHGDHVFKPLVHTYSGRMEQYTPFMFMIVPKKYANKYGRHEKLSEN